MTAQDRPVPRYVAIRNAIEQRVADGTYPPGSALPSENRLAAEFAVARDTVIKALTALKHTGLIESRQGKASYVRAATLSVPASRLLGDIKRLIPSLPSPVTEVEHDVLPSLALSLGVTSDDLHTWHHIYQERVFFRPFQVPPNGRVGTANLGRSTADLIALMGSFADNPHAQQLTIAETVRWASLVRYDLGLLWHDVARLLAEWVPVTKAHGWVYAIAGVEPAEYTTAVEASTPFDPTAVHTMAILAGHGPLFPLADHAHPVSSTASTRPRPEAR